MIRRPPRSTLFPTRRSSDLGTCVNVWREETTGLAGRRLRCRRRRHRRAIRFWWESGRHLFAGMAIAPRSEEHTSELQSRLHLVCRLLLEKKKKKKKLNDTIP